MEIKEYIEYLQQFPEGSKIGFMIVNPDRNTRLVYPVKEVCGITDLDIPTVCITVGNGEPIDEQIDIFEFMED